MKYILIILFSLPILIGYAQSTKAEQSKTDTSILIVKVLRENATKGGLYIKDGFILDDFSLFNSVLEISQSEIDSLEGKTIEFVAISTIVKGLNSYPKYNEEGNLIVRQGRSYDTKHYHVLEYKIMKE